MKKLAFTILFLITCAIQGCESGRDENESLNPNEFDFHLNEPTPEFRKDAYKKADNYFKEWFLASEFSGQYIVAKNGHIIYNKAQGYSNKEKGTVLTDTTPIHVASISKVATAIAVLRLVDQKLIKLDGKVCKYLKGFPYADISVRMLMNHRSGLPYYGYFIDDYQGKRRIVSNKDILRVFKKHKIPLNSTPDTHFAYCNTNYAILALIVESVTHSAFPVAMKELIFDPLKMKHSFIVSSKEEAENVSKSYNSRFHLESFDFLDAVYGDKNLYTTASDLMLLDKATYFNDFLSKKMQKEMFRGYSYEYKGTKNYGLGIRIREEKGKESFFFHTGWWHGSTGMYCSLRKDTVCVIALSNVFNKRVYNLKPLVMQFGNYPFEDVAP